jgi:hypothetical protein
MTRNVRRLSSFIALSTKAVLLASRGFVAKRRHLWRGRIFDDLVQRHATSSEAEHAILEPVIYSQSITYRRDVKRGSINPDPNLDALLAGYKARLMRNTN